MDKLVIDEVIRSKDEIRDYLYSIATTTGRIFESRHKKQVALHNEKALRLQSILDKYPVLTFQMVRYILLDNPDLEFIPFRCVICGKPITQDHADGSIKMTCSASCSTVLGKTGSKQSPETKKRREETCLQKYGVKNPRQAKSVSDKIKQTNLERYGFEYAIGSEDVREKIRQTNNSRYGVDNPWQAEEIKERIRQTNEARYGTEIAFQSEEVKARARQTNLEKYGTSSSWQAEEVRSRIEQTNLKRYGARSPLHSEIIKKKIRSEFRASRFGIFSNILADRSIEMLTSYADHLIADNIKFRCSKCGTEFDSVYDSCEHQSLIWCPMCHQAEGYSEIESQIYEFVSGLIGVHNVFRNVRQILSDKKELDLYIPVKNLAIEVDGIYFHRAELKDKNYHITKTLDCSDKGIHLLHIFDAEWMYKKEIVQSIIKSKLGIYDTVIYARKCEVKEITTSEYRLFLETNHLQGYATALIKLGLFYEDELVACIGIGQSRFKKDETELIRFCTKLNTSIVGGLSKLISHSGIAELISYVDLRYFDGSGYRKAGFVLENNTEPGYVYVKGRQILSRYQCQKYKLLKILGATFDPALSESENMLNNGWYKVYDCGMLKFKYKLDS